MPQLVVGATPRSRKEDRPFWTLAHEIWTIHRSKSGSEPRVLPRPQCGGPEHGVTMRKMTYGFRATMTARPGKGQELVDVLLSGAPDGTGSGQGCVVFLVGRSAANPDVVHVTEGWTSKEAHAKNFATAESQANVARIIPLLGGEAQYDDEVPVGGRAQ